MRHLRVKHIYLFVLVMLFSCGDDFIDVDPQDATSDTFFNTEADYQSALSKRNVDQGNCTIFGYSSWHR